jgi:hypothetical protein
MPPLRNTLVHYSGPILLACGGIFYALKLFDFGYIHGDEGIALMGGWRVALGQIPHRDFFEFFPPFSFLLTAFFFKLFGTGFFAERLLVMVYALVLILGSDHLLRHFTKNMTARCLVASFLIPYGVLQWPLPSHHWVVDIVQLLALTTLLNGLNRSPLFWGWWAGIFTALGCFSMQDQGGYLVITLLLFFFPFVRGKEIRNRVFLGWVMGAGIVAALFAVYLLPHVSITELIYQWVIFPATRYDTIAGNVGSLMNLGLQEIGTPGWMDYLRNYPDYTIPQTVIAILLPSLPIIAIVCLGLELARRRYPKPLIGLLAAGGLTFMGGCLHRFAQTNLVWAAPLLMIILAISIAGYLESGGKWQRYTAQTVALGIIGMSLVYAEGNLRLKLTTDTVQVTGAAGTLTVPARSTESSMQLVIDGIEQTVPKKSPLFCTEYNPMINFWTQRLNPTRYNFFLSPAFHTNEQSEEVIKTLVARPDAYILLFVPLVDNEDRLGWWAYRNYQVAWRFPWALLLKR